MNTIDEVESPTKGTESEPDYPLLAIEPLAEPLVVPVDQPDLNESNTEEEDELLNRM